MNSAEHYFFTGDELTALVASLSLCIPEMAEHPDKRRVVAYKSVLAKIVRRHPELRDVSCIKQALA